MRSGSGGRRPAWPFPEAAGRRDPLVCWGFGAGGERGSPTLEGFVANMLASPRPMA